MSNGEIAFFSLVICAMFTFAAVIGFVSWWSKPRSNSNTANPSLANGTEATGMGYERGRHGEIPARADHGFSAAA